MTLIEAIKSGSKRIRSTDGPYQGWLEIGKDGHFYRDDGREFYITAGVLQLDYEINDPAKIVTAADFWHAVRFINTDHDTGSGYAADRAIKQLAAKLGLGENGGKG